MLTLDRTSTPPLLSGYNWNTVWTDQDFGGFDVGVLNMYIRAVNERMQLITIWNGILAQNCYFPFVIRAPFQYGQWVPYNGPFPQTQIGDYVLLVPGSDLTYLTALDYTTYQLVNNPIVPARMIATWATLQAQVADMAQYFVKNLESDGSTIATFAGKHVIDPWTRGNQGVGSVYPAIYLNGVNGDLSYGNSRGWPPVGNSFYNGYGPNYSIPDIFTRKYPRELIKWGDNGLPRDAGAEGQIGRLILSESINIYDAYGNIVTTRPPTCLERWLSGKIFIYHEGGWEFSQDQSLSPDIITDKGLIQVGDYFGAWILNDLRDAINLLSWTFAWTVNGTDAGNSPSRIINDGDNVFPFGIYHGSTITVVPSNKNVVLSNFSYIAAYDVAYTVTDACGAIVTEFVHEPDPCAVWGVNPTPSGELYYNPTIDGGQEPRLRGLNPAMEGKTRSIDVYSGVEYAGTVFFSPGVISSDCPQFQFTKVATLTVTTNGDPVLGLVVPDFVTTQSCAIIKWDSNLTYNRSYHGI